MHFAPHRDVQRHLALRHEHAAIDLQANRLAQLNPVAAGVGAITLDRFTGGGGDICRGGQGDQAGEDQDAFHKASLAQFGLLTKPDASDTPPE